MGKKKKAKENYARGRRRVGDNGLHKSARIEGGRGARRGDAKEAVRSFMTLMHYSLVFWTIGCTCKVCV